VDAFIGAGDAVMLRLKHHIQGDPDGHVYEQINKATGEQYNARDLTWSYAEILGALGERKKAKAKEAPEA
jgi:GH15 family glucan-1,4-alpha-glucosidase